MNRAAYAHGVRAIIPRANTFHPALSEIAGETRWIGTMIAVTTIVAG